MKDFVENVNEKIGTEENLVAEVSDDLRDETDDYEEFYDEEEVVYEEVVETVHPIPLTRGEEGVYDIDDIVALLRAENGIDICTIEVPDDRNYVDYMVIVTGRSKRHLLAMAEYVKFLYKKRRGPNDPESVNIEGKDATDWIAMDLGNIAVHFFLPQVRGIYDLETLWTVGEEFDDNVLAEAEQTDPYAFLFEQTETEGNTENDNESIPVSESEIESDSGDVADERRHHDNGVQSFSSHSSKWHKMPS